ncbi:MAG TPA: glucose-1-phosphate adenylyltransferase [Vicinamibacterales bacterium]|nr:glucose-1-phosphate adenylyltransferase [Vicinamibacterales bacterium]HPW19954.1 glucose-1-phosphate adenylyltransferase [Vicinamibacterales bacterium]
MHDVLAIILGGGRGNRLFPLTLVRSKPAVPIGGKYRLIDIPISNCLHAEVRRMFVLTQFNSASLNRHISQTYRMDLFSNGFVDILAAEQTPDNPHWFQGTADAVRKASRHFQDYRADYYLVLAGDHLYRMDFADLIDSHVARSADITIAAQPVVPGEASEMGIFLFDKGGQIAGFEEKPNAARLGQIARSIPEGSSFAGHSDDKPFVASMGIYVFSRRVLLDLLQRANATDFGREIIPAAIGTHRVNAYLYDGYWADVGTVESFYEANMLLTRDHPPFRFHDPKRPIFTRPRFLTASRFIDSCVSHSMVAEGCYINRCRIETSIVGIRTSIGEGALVRRSVLLGADFYGTDEEETGDRSVPLGIGADSVLDRVIVDKNARIGRGVRLVNERGLVDADGDNYFIRGGIIIVPKGAVVPDGTVV